MILTFRSGERLDGPPDSDGGPTEHQKVYLLGMLRSVDDWPLAKTLKQIPGGKPRPVAVDSST